MAGVVYAIRGPQSRLAPTAGRTRFEHGWRRH